MPSPHTTRRSGAWAVVLAVVLALVVLLAGYVVSMGPAFAMMSRGQISVGTFQTAYRPLIRLTITSDVVEFALIRYTVGWDEHWPGKPLEKI